MIASQRAAILVTLTLAMIPASWAILSAVAYAWRGRHLRRAIRAGDHNRRDGQGQSNYVENT